MDTCRLVGRLRYQADLVKARFDLRISQDTHSKFPL
jgi:hypothetical protein